MAALFVLLYTICTMTSSPQKNLLVRSFTIIPTATTTTMSKSRHRHQPQQRHIFGRLYSSFTADGSEYAAGDSDFDTDDDYDEANAAARNNKNGNDDDEQFEDDDDENRFVPTIELQPVPISKNAGNRFVAVIWDNTIKNRERFAKNNEIHNDDDSKTWTDHYDRIQYTEDHVLFCRKQNLYNATFNNHSMVDILWSLPM